MIFMDHMMPEMDGVEALNRIRKLEGNPNSDIPIIALTANAIVGAEEEYLSLGFADYVSKPVRGKVLEKVVVRFLPKELVKEAKEEKKVKKDQPSRLHARRQMLKVLYPVVEVPTEAAGKKANTKKVDLVAKLFDEYGTKYASRKGGYTRIVKVGERRGDGAMVVILELV